jgi:hypothetical protein
MTQLVAIYPKEEYGIVYIATGNACRQEAIRSAKCVKQYNSKLVIAIFSDHAQVDPVFDQTFAIENPDFSTIDKVKHLWMTPF